MTNKCTVAICTFNRSRNLAELIGLLREQECPVPFDILVVDNNSSDSTQQVLAELARNNGVPLRVVTERQQGITYARNRAIEESFGSSFLAFIDDDELPATGWLKAAIDALDREEAECVGGEIQVRLPTNSPRWIDDSLLGFLGKVSYGAAPFWVMDSSTPIWSGNIAYRMSIFKDGLRFDHRYNRAGFGIGGGSDSVMFQELLNDQRRIRYRPDMKIVHLVEEFKLSPYYFLKLHFKSGCRSAQWHSDDYPSSIMGIPPFMVRQLLTHIFKTLIFILRRKSGLIRQGMNAAHAAGMLVGCWRRRRYGGEKR